MDNDVVLKYAIPSMEHWLPLGKEFHFPHVAGKQKNTNVGQDKSHTGVPVLEVALKDLSVACEQVHIVQSVLPDQLNVGLKNFLAYLTGYSPGCHSHQKSGHPCYHHLAQSITSSVVPISSAGSLNCKFSYLRSSS